MKESQLGVFKSQVAQHSKGQEIDEDMLSKMAQMTTCDLIVLHPNIPETKHISVNMYVDDKGVSKEVSELAMPMPLCKYSS